MFCPIPHQNVERYSDHVLKIYIIKKIRYGQNTFVIEYIFLM